VEAIVAAIDLEIERHEREKPVRKDKFDRYNKRLTEVAWRRYQSQSNSQPPCPGEARRAELESEHADLQNDLSERRFEQRSIDEESKVNDELHSLRPSQQRSRVSLELRQRLGTTSVSIPTPPVCRRAHPSPRGGE